MAASPQHVTLTANTVSTLNFDVDFNWVEITSLDGAAEIYVSLNGQTDPTVGGNGFHVIPAGVVSSSVFPIFTGNVTQVRLISAGTPRVSVRGSVERLA